MKEIIGLAFYRHYCGWGCVGVVVRLFPSDIIIQMAATETVDVSIDGALETLTSAMLRRTSVFRCY